MKENDLFILKM